MLFHGQRVLLKRISIETFSLKWAILRSKLMRNWKKCLMMYFMGPIKSILRSVILWLISVT